MEDAPLAYDLRAPAAARGESITSQLQREILGDVAVPVSAPEQQSSPRTTRQREQLLSQNEELNGPNTPQPSRRGGDDDADLIAITTPEALSQKGSSTESQEQQEQQQQLQQSANEREGDRRRTLSPSKALAFFHQEGIRDSRLSTTTSRRDTVSPEAIRRLLHGGDDSASSRRASIASALGLDPADESIDDNMLNEYLNDIAGTKQLVESSKQTLVQSPPDAKRRRSPRGKAAQVEAKGTAAATATDQDSFTDAFFSQTLMSRDDEDGANENDAVDGKQRRTTLEPTDAMSILSELRSETMSVDGQPQDSRRATIDAATNNVQRESPSPNTRSRKRRATLDPNDLMAMTDGGDVTLVTTVAAATPANRRDTIGDGDLEEMRREFGMEAPAARAKAKSPSPVKRAAADKRTRFGVQDDDDDEPMVTPVKSKGPSVTETDTLFSPPPTIRGKTPLKSCLSARKAKRDQPTPSKSVNFGPPQGAEFNLGSPSTSMTPLPSRDARAMFPLDEVEPPVSEDDDETSLNTSILDEADAQDSSDEERNAAMLLEAQQRKLSVDPQRARRRYSLRGVSPLDNQANARRQRRLSTTSASTQPMSPLVSARNRRAFEAAAAAASAAVQAKNAAPAQQKSSFLSASETIPQSRLAYADSSASSDEGEDMEITGDYSNHASTAKTLQTGVRESRLSESPRRSARIGSARQDSLFVDSPLSDTTIELGTLRDLVDEAYEEEKKEESNSDMSEDNDDDDDDLVIGSLSDLAKEAEVEGEEEEIQASQSSSQASVAPFTASQEKTLDPIVEVDDEDRRSSSAHSMMSLDSDDDSDDEYNAKRKSLVVNLSSKFERFGSGTPKKRKSVENSSSLLNRLRSPQRQAASPRVVLPPSPSPVKLPDPLKTDEVLARVQLEQISREVVEGIDMDILPTDVQRSCVANAAAGDLRFSINEIASWVSGLADSLPALGHERVSRVFSTEDPMALTRLNESIQALHIMESIHVRSGYCQWRTKLEKRVCDKLVQCENNLVSDAKTLRSQRDNDRAHRESEMRAIKELMERERQMEQLLAGIEEQQVVQREYQSSVQELESQCSSLSLEASVLDQQLEALQLSSPQIDRTEATAVQLRREVLEAEELLAVRESIGLWRVVSASGSKLSIVSRYDDVLFSVDVRVSIDAAGADGQSSLHIVPVFTRKTHQQKHPQHEPGDSHLHDAVSSVAASLLSATQVEAFESTSMRMAQLPSQLMELSMMLQRTYQYLSDLRFISTVCGLTLENTSDTERTLWIDFIRFPRETPLGAVVDGVKFRIGLDQQTSWPFTNYESQIAIAYGTVTEEKIRQQLDSVPPQGGLEYVARVCRRLHDVFVLNSA